MFAKLSTRGPHARGGARPAEARAGRERNRDQGRHDQPGVPAAAARPRRGAARSRRRRLARSPQPAGRSSDRAITPGSRCCRPPSRCTTRRPEAELEEFFSGGGEDAADVPARCRAAGRGRLPRPPLPVQGVPAGASGVPRSTSRGRGSTSSSSGWGRRERWITHGEHRYHVLSFVAGLHPPGRGGRRAAPDLARGRRASSALRARRWWSACSVKAGDYVAAGDRLAVLESMKMELAVTAPFSGTVRQVLVMANAQVGAGAPLRSRRSGAGRRRRRRGTPGDVRGDLAAQGAAGSAGVAGPGRS